MSATSPESRATAWRIPGHGPRTAARWLPGIPTIRGAGLRRPRRPFSRCSGYDNVPASIARLLLSRRTRALQIGHVPCQGTNVAKDAPRLGHRAVARPVERRSETVARKVLDGKEQHHEIGGIDHPAISNKNRFGGDALGSH